MVDVLVDLRPHPTDAISDEGQVLQDCEQGFWAAALLKLLALDLATGASGGEGTALQKSRSIQVG